jgi:hypothetical protein
MDANLQRCGHFNGGLQTRLARLISWGFANHNQGNLFKKRKL